ncbi:transglutaminase family protein [Candidatus Woesearchaeota archaeon]|nr:transglutaminase family protein [Candidatus Woesearchaeota archaeon]
MKKTILLLLLIPIVFAQTDWFQAQTVTTELNVSSTIDIIPTGPEPKVETIQADVIFIPKNTEYTAIRKIETKPAATITAEKARYEWKNPPTGTIPYKYTATIETINNVPRVKAKTPYPTKFPENVQEYTRPTKNIDSNNANILAQAYLLAQNEKDLFMLVSKIGKWAKHNTQYNLSTLTAEATQPASWTLLNKQGVCDEITGLFIALLRSLKIPARFISGVAYTNDPQFPQGWATHGWAEVYFPGTGWVPFDVTFGEYGWINPGHIKLKESLDPQEPTTILEWKAKNAEIKIHDLEITAGLLEAQGKTPPELKLTMTPLRARVGFGSYNAAILEAENLADYYVASEFRLAKVTEITTISDETQTIILPPRERGKIYWKLKVEDGLNRDFQYEIPLQAQNQKNLTASGTFSTGIWDVVFSEKDIDTVIEKTEQQKGTLDLSCMLENDYIWTEKGRLNCIIENYAEKEVPATICYKECKEITIPAKGETPITFDITTEKPGPQEIEITAKSGSTTKKAILTIIRMDEPKIKIKDITTPETVLYGEPFELKFTLERESIAFPQNVAIEVKGGGATAKVDVGELTINQEIIVNIQSEQLFSRKPTFDIKANYKDMFGKQYSTEGETTVNIQKMPFYKRLLGWLADLF